MEEDSSLQEVAERFRQAVISGEATFPRFLTNRRSNMTDTYYEVSWFHAGNGEVFDTQREYTFSLARALAKTKYPYNEWYIDRIVRTRVISSEEG